MSGCGSQQLHPITSKGRSVHGQVGDARQTCLVELQAYFNTISHIPTITPSFLRSSESLYKLRRLLPNARSLPTFPVNQLGVTKRYGNLDPPEPLFSILVKRQENCCRSSPKLQLPAAAAAAAESIITMTTRAEIP